ncbi:MAG: hypothetical protein KGL39_21170 [Patescibacteria group bacterium]|nr:hypothetical protein [Patescibacteria group bacterium]
MNHLFIGYKFLINNTKVFFMLIRNKFNSILKFIFYTTVIILLIIVFYLSINGYINLGEGTSSAVLAVTAFVIGFQAFYTKDLVESQTKINRDYIARGLISIFRRDVVDLNRKIAGRLIKENKDYESCSIAIDEFDFQKIKATYPNELQTQLRALQSAGTKDNNIFIELQDMFNTMEEICMQINYLSESSKSGNDLIILVIDSIKRGVISIVEKNIGYIFIEKFINDGEMFSEMFSEIFKFYKKYKGSEKKGEKYPEKLEQLIKK